MNERTGVISLMRGAVVPTLCIALIGYFTFHALAGTTGLLSWSDYSQRKTALLQQSEQLKASKANLEQKIALLNPHRVDPDLADELVRKDLGVVRADEVVVQLPKSN
jgi:cell division protein FtsB